MNACMYEVIKSLKEKIYQRKMGKREGGRDGGMKMYIPCLLNSVDILCVKDN